MDINQRRRLADSYLDIIPAIVGHRALYSITIEEAISDFAETGKMLVEMRDKVSDHLKKSLQEDSDES